MTIDELLLNMGVIQPHERRRFSHKVREILARLSNYRCENCHRPIALGADDLLMQMNAGHVVAWSKGGSNSWDNLVCLCAHCNQMQNNKSFVDAFGLLAAFRLNAQVLVNGILGALME